MSFPGEAVMEAARVASGARCSVSFTDQPSGKTLCSIETQTIPQRTASALGATVVEAWEAALTQMAATPDRS